MMDLYYIPPTEEEPSVTELAEMPFSSDPHSQDSSSPDTSPSTPLLASLPPPGDGPPRLLLRQRLAYSVGHFYNDLCASMWFSYLLVYFQYLLGFENELAGYLLLLGQIVDAVSTPIIGFESDRTAGFCGYGKRKSWHLVGTVFVSLSFPFLFLQCLGCAHSAHWAQFVYYAPFVTAFQIGWASVQIAHLSIINQLTSNESERVELYAWRNASTLLASIIVYGTAWALLGVNKGTHWESADISRFMILMLIVVGLGLLLTTLYHVGVPEAHDTAPREDHSGLSAHALAHCSSSMEWKDWLCEWQFYVVAALYMLSRLLFNISQTYWPMFLTETLQLEKEFSAIIPMVICVAGFFTSFTMRAVNRIVGRKRTFALGLVVSAASFCWIWFLPRHSMQVFGPAVLIGVGGNTLIISSLSMAADIIGNNVRSSAFVYGAMSFTDKLSSGVAVMLVQRFRPVCSCALVADACCKVRAEYFDLVMVLVPAGCLVGCVGFLLVIAPMKLGALRKYSQSHVVDPVDVQTPPQPWRQGEGEEDEDREEGVEDETSPLLRFGHSCPTPPSPRRPLVDTTHRRSFDSDESLNNVVTT